ncbi:uncharacterized protein LOC106021825 [Mesocricetus auratus]|uniref:Uncharacterized protein LOC106021825 n=1 Tax=Mesocricetus auratus TaxID=10036 RepID=A0ABM2W5W8_MESAU|nr:uncharacterized protein LOC106021825 [Mesocricetus auratus]
MGRLLQKEGHWLGSQLTSPGRTGAAVRPGYECGQNPQPRASGVCSPTEHQAASLARRLRAVLRLRGLVPALPGIAKQRGEQDHPSQAGDLQAPGDPGHTRPARWRRAPLPFPRGRERAAVTSRATRQPRAPPGRARAAAEHMDPLAERAPPGRDEGELRTRMRASKTQSPPLRPRVDIHAERMLAARVTWESWLNLPSRLTSMWTTVRRCPPTGCVCRRHGASRRDFLSPVDLQ